MSTILGYFSSLLRGAYTRASALFSGDDSRNKQQLFIIATNTVQLLQENRWNELRAQFIFPLRFLLTETLLRKGWEMITATMGPVQHVGQPIVSTGWLPTANVPIRFARGSLSVNLQMPFSGRLMGLRVSPLGAVGLGEDWQHPPYAEVGAQREVGVQLGSKLEVPGILCLPKQEGVFPCVILLAGSGPCDRDSSVGSLKPFKDLALGLAQQGIASIRFDKVTLKHPHKFRNSSSITIGDEYFDQANDAITKALQHKEIDPHRIFIIGHSLGAAVAPYLTQNDDRVRGAVLLTAPSDSIYRAWVRQLHYFASLDSEPVEAMQELIAEAEKKSDTADRLGPDFTVAAQELPFGLPASYWTSYRELDPIGTAQKLKKPVLVLQGSRDYQVTVADDFVKWENALSKNSNALLRVYEGLDHCFVHGEGVSTPADYDKPGNVEVAVIRDISSWILDSEAGGSWDILEPTATR